jgi:hypothetical protein
MEPYEPVQYSGPIYLNTVSNITEYQPPTSEMEQRRDIPIKKTNTFLKPAVPKISLPNVDRVPQEVVDKTPKISQSEYQKIFLENSRSSSSTPLQMHDESKKTSGLAKPLPSLPFLFGTFLGLILVYRALKHYQ